MQLRNSMIQVRLVLIYLWIALLCVHNSHADAPQPLFYLNGRYGRSDPELKDALSYKNRDRFEKSFIPRQFECFYTTSGQLVSCFVRNNGFADVPHDKR